MKRKQEERNYIIITFYQGNSVQMGAVRYASSQVDAILAARSALHNTWNWQAVVYRWNEKESRVESFVAAYDTIGGKKI